MNITKEWLKQNEACSAGLKWFLGQTETEVKAVIKKLMAENKFDWANWILARCLTRDQKIEYAVFAAEQVIEIYEQDYPADARPREAIEAAKACLTADAADAADDVGYAADVTTYAAADVTTYAAARAAARAAAYAAADAADAAADVTTYAAARAASYAASYAAAYAVNAEDAAYAATMKKTINYGLTLLTETVSPTTKGV